MKYYIYKLLDPETKEIRYIGKSVDPNNTIKVTKIL